VRIKDFLRYIIMLGAGKSRETIYSKFFICSLGYSQGSA